MPIEVHFVSGKHVPCLICEQCHESVSPAAPARCGYLANRDGNAVTPALLTLHEGECLERYLLCRSPYHFHSWPFSELSSLLAGA